MTALPLLLNLCGVELTARGAPVELEHYRTSPPGEQEDLLFLALRGNLVHGLLEWTAAGIAILTAVFACVHYFLQRDPTTPIIGSALFFAGTLDAFHTLASNHLIGSVADPAEFIPFTWTISRFFHAVILVLGTAPLAFSNRTDSTQHGKRFILLSAVLFGLVSYIVIMVCAAAPSLPRAVSASPIIKRPWDLFPLGLYLLAGGITLPRLYRKRPSLFARGLQVSVIPHAVSQLYAAFGSSELFDNGANVASYLKIVGYCVPLVGLMIDYAHSSRAEAKLLATRQQLRMAQEVQLSLLPQTPPDVAGFEIVGEARFAESLGGDFFDFIPLLGWQDGPSGVQQAGQAAHPARADGSDSLASPSCAWLVTVADVSGHDPGASMLMAKTRAYLRALARDTHDPSLLLRRLNEFVTRDVQGRRFVTMFLTRIDPHTGAVWWSAAGHSAYLIRRAGPPQEIKASTIPLGVDVERFQPPLSQCSLEQDDLLLICTDGLLEATSPAGEEFGLERVTRAIRDSLRRPVEEILKSLQQAVGRHRQTSRLADDVTIVLIRRQES